MNMKNYVYVSFLLIALSCNSFLDELPDDRAVIDTPEKIGELLTYAYPDKNHQMFCYAMSDNATEKKSSRRQSPILEDAYNWQEHRLTSQDTPESYWNSCYSAIKQINHALDAIRKKKTEKGKIPQILMPYYGEALVARAYCHFMLVSLWSKAYDPKTANTDLGIPYVTKPETTVMTQYSRGTVDEVYEKIEKDLTEGLKYIDDNIYENKKMHWNKDAAHTFAARFYSIIGNFKKVLEYTNKVLSTAPQSQLRNLTEKYSKMDINEAILEWGKSSERANLLVKPQYSSWFTYFYGTFRYGMSTNFHRFVFRKPFVGGEWIWNLYGQNPDIFFVKWGYYTEKTGINSEVGYYMIMNSLIEIEEALFLRMEANAMLNNFNDVETDMNAYLSKRIKNYIPEQQAVSYKKIQQEYSEPKQKYQLSPFYSFSEKQRTYMNCIYDLRRKEFYYNGMRWFDHKRFNTKVKHYHRTGNQIKSLAPKDNRKQLQIPESAQSQGIKANP